MDDSIVEVHGHTKQGAGFGYTQVRGLNSFIGTVSTSHAAPVIVAQRLRKGSCGSARGAARLVADTLATVKRLLQHRRRRAGAAAAGGLGVLRAQGGRRGTPREGRRVHHGAADHTHQSSDQHHPRRCVDDDQVPASSVRRTIGSWISRAEVAEIGFTAFTSRKNSEQVPGRLVVRRIPEPNPKAVAGQPSLFDTWRFHAFFTTSTLDTVTADKTHRGHAIIEQVHADLKHSAMADLPLKSFAANSAWLVLAAMAFNLTRAAAALSGPQLAKATTGTIRRTLIVVRSAGLPASPVSEGVGGLSGGGGGWSAGAGEQFGPTGLPGPPGR